MISLLAESSPPAEAIKTWIEILVWIAGGIAACAVAWSHLTGKSGERQISPQPLEVKAHDVPATQGDIDQLHGRIKRERMEIDKAVAELRAEDLRLREKLDADIADLHDRITNVPERTIKLLRETKGLI